MNCLFAAILLVSAFLLSSCGERNPALAEKPAPPAQEETGVPEPDPEPPAPSPEELADQQIDTLLSSMTLEEKVGQVFFVR